MFLEETQKYIYNIRKPIDIRIKTPMVTAKRKKISKKTSSSVRVLCGSVNSDRKFTQTLSQMTHGILKSSKQDLLPRVFTS